MKLSAIESLPSFALLGPGFSGGGWTLLTGLSTDSSDTRVVFQPYEATEPFVFGAERSETVEVEWDVAPSALSPSLNESGHAEAVGEIRDAIAAGDVYQVNFTLRASLDRQPGSALLATLCRSQTPRFAAWVRLPNGAEFVSASPELFFAVNGRSVSVEPMKGTAPNDAEHALETSEKDISELAMITDLMRNDLVPICEPRSVQVVAERRFIRLAYAIQAVSDVSGILKEGTEALDVLKALHPGGSITGAPKHAAMQMISTLESTPRGAYCGALGLCSDDSAVFSLLIRTAERHPDGWTYGVGGGIVWDSSAEGELEEARLKLGALR